MSRKFWLWAPVVIYMAAIFVVSSLSQPPSPPGVDDKTLHAAAYLGLAAVVVRALAGGLPARVSLATATAALAITIAYGASDEYHQRFVPGRTSDIRDLRADAIGGLIGTAACWSWGIIASLSRARHDL